MPKQTGPRTDEGKSASSQNNRQHGLSTANIIVSAEERPFFDQMESELRDEIVPAGPLEDFAFQRLVTASWQIEKCRQKEASLRALELTEQNEANLEKVHRYYQRWEGSYNSALRQIRMLQTDRGIQGYVIGKPVENFSPLADVSKIEQFARRIAQPVTYQSELRKALATQHAIIILEKQITNLGAVPITYQHPERERQVADPSTNPVNPTKSTTCETKSAQQPEVGLGRRSLGEVGRNSPCPCGSGQKYKRCCGVNAPPILNKVA